MKSLAMLFLLLFSACASTPKGDSPEWREQNRDQFVRHLQKHDARGAAPFALFFTGQAPEDQALMAQYHLFSCQPNAAEKSILNISNENERKLFLAVLYGLVSEENSKDSSIGTAITAYPEGAPILAVLPIEAGDEVWADEWDQMITQKAPCLMPRISDKESRAVAREYAKGLFEQLTLADYLKDFTVVTLALQTNAEIPFRKELLAHYKNLKGNSDYQKLAELFPNSDEHADAIHVVAQNSKTAEISLSTLDLSLDDPDTRPQDVPLLIDGEKAQ